MRLSTISLLAALMLSGCVVRTTHRTPTIEELGDHRGKIGPNGKIEEKEVIWLWGKQREK